jgi:pantothenate kinase
LSHSHTHVHLVYSNSRASQSFFKTEETTSVRDMLETLLNTAHSTQMRQYIKVSMQEVLIGRSGVMDFTELAKKVMKKGLGKGSAGGVKAEGKLENFTQS